jgi:hypothetical protein
LIARSTLSGDLVTWDRIRHGSDAREEEFPIDGEAFVFDAQQYQDAILDRGEPITSWTPTTRRAAVLVQQRAKSWRGEEHRLRFIGVEDLGHDQLRLATILAAGVKIATAVVEIIGTGQRSGWNAGGWARGTSGCATVAWYAALLVALADA